MSTKETSKPRSKNTSKKDKEGKGKKLNITADKNRKISKEKKLNITADKNRNISKAVTNKLFALKREIWLTDNEGSYIERKNLFRNKEKVASEILELQAVLGAAKRPDAQEMELEKLVFGCNAEDLHDMEEGDDTDLPVIKEKEKSLALQPAWEDEDDESLLVKEKVTSLDYCHRSVSVRGEEKYSEYAQEKFIKLMGAPKWAELGGTDENNSSDESDDELLRTTGNFIQKSENLAKGCITAHKCRSLVDASLAASPIKTVEFHPTSRVALVASTNGTAHLFQVDGKINSKIQSVYFENFPIQTAHFTVDGSEIIAGSYKFAHLFAYDMFAGKISKIPWQKGMQQRNMRKFHMSPDGKYIVIHGKYGNIHLMKSKSKEWVGTLKMNGNVDVITFNRDGSQMYSHGDTGEVYVWDMNTRKCIHKFVDEGCIVGTALALSPNNQFFATGSDSGVVNIYDNSTLLSTASPQPMKVLLNLTNAISNLKFNNTSEILAMSSFHKDDHIRLVHFPSLTVFSNFPSIKESIRRPNSFDFSPNSGYLCVGNNVGTAYIYRLKHYKNY